MSLNVERAKTLLEQIAQNTVNLKRNEKLLDNSKNPIGIHYDDFTDELRFSKGEIFVEVALDEFSTVKSRLVGFCIEFKEFDATKKLKIWCTKNNEAVDVVVSPVRQCRVGVVDNGHLHKVTSICFDCKEELLDCHCVR